jgi:pimeloyl-ACP methyl ester carboxylesterase
MPFVELRSSPLAPGVAPVRIHYREQGVGRPTSARVDRPPATVGRPLVILHGGWGYEIYPFDRQIAALANDHRIVIPDRTGYGLSGRLERQESNFHHRAAAETFAVIDALGLDRPVLWGHSDGAVIALLMALAAPARLDALVLEATHFYRAKPASRVFFETMRDDPDGLGARIGEVLAREHGAWWRDLLRTNGAAWLKIAEERTADDDDLYGGQLATLGVPALLLHGARDPRTEPGELDALRRALAAVGQVAILEEGGHSPHSERGTADEVTRTAQRFLAAPADRGRPAAS